MSAIATQIPAATWQADLTHSTVGFAVKYMGVQTFRGRFEEFAATLESDTDGTLSLRGTVPVESLKVKDENLQAHLKSPDFFDVERHPEISFSSTGVRTDGDELIVDGDLTINGITKRVEGRGSVAGPSETPFGTTVLAVTLDTVVDRHEYGITWNAPLPKGGNVLADDVKIAVELEFVKA